MQSFSTLESISGGVHHGYKGCDVLLPIRVASDIAGLGAHQNCMEFSIGARIRNDTYIYTYG